MAVKQVNLSVTSLSFTRMVAGGTPETMSVTFTNQSSPTASVDVTVVSPAAPFSISASDNSFTLAADTDSRTVVVTFAPTAAGSSSDILEITANNGFSFNPIVAAINLSGSAFSNTYALANIANNPAGTMKVDLVIDKYLPELTVPTKQTILDVGPRGEIVDVEPGVVETQSLDIAFSEDYTTYTEGFWFHILQAFPQRITPALPALADRDGNEGGGGSGHWVGHGNHAIAQDATHVYEGSQAFKITATGDGDFTTNYVELPTAYNTAFSPGNRMGIALWFYLTDTSPSMPNSTTININVENAGVEGNVMTLATKDSSGNVAGLNQWNLYSFEGIIGSNGSIKIAISGLPGATTATVWMDSIVVWQSINDPQLRFILTESGTDRFYFWGRINRIDTQWDERFNNGSTFIRIKSTRLISIIQTLKDMPTQQLPAELQTHEDKGVTVWTWSFIKVRDFLQACIKVGFVQSQAFTGFGIITAFAAHTISRASGSFVTDGWYIGAVGRIIQQQTGVTDPANDSLSFTVTNVAALTLTVSETLTAFASPGSVTLTEDLVLIRNSDFRVKRYGSETTTNVEDARIISQFDVRGYWRGYTQQSQNPYYISNLFGNIFDVVKNVCLNEGWTARYYFGQADGTYAGDGTDKHRFELCTRGRSFAGLVTAVGGIVKSTYAGECKARLQNILVTDVHNVNDTQPGGSIDQTSGTAWVIRGIQNNCPDPQLTASNVNYKQDGINDGNSNPPQWAQFDLNVSILFIISPWYFSGGVPTPTDASGRGLWIYYHDGSGDHWQIATRVQYWNYRTGQWTERGSMQKALSEYFDARFALGRKMIGREYGSLKFNDGVISSQAVIRPMVRTSINDGTGASTYYASEVKSDFKKNHVAVTWVEE